MDFPLPHCEQGLRLFAAFYAQHGDNAIR